MASIKRVPISRIYLDNENPRHDPMESEPEIIEHLLAQEDVRPLAKSIAELGSLSPIELLGVVPHPKVEGGYLAAEGNRRTCALKLLSDPDKAISEKDKKYFRGLAEQLTAPIREIDAVIFENEEAARPWVSLRHEGPQSGRGTKSWNTEQKARFSMKASAGNHPDILALQLLDFAVARNVISKIQRETISITTLTRYLSNKIFRHALGLQNNKDLTLSIEQTAFERRLEIFLTDALQGDGKISSRSNSAEREAYARELVQRYHEQSANESSSRDNGGRGRNYHPGDSREEPANQGSYEANDLKQESREKTGFGGNESDDEYQDTESDQRNKGATRNNPSPDKRKYVVPSAFKVSIREPVLKRLFDELRGLDPESYSFAATYLFRGVLEQLVTLYLRKKGAEMAGELHRKLSKAADLLVEDGLTDAQVKQLRKMANDRESSYSPDTIGHFIHGGAVPGKVYVLKAWDSIATPIEKMFGALN